MVRGEQPLWISRYSKNSAISRSRIVFNSCVPQIIACRKRYSLRHVLILASFPFSCQVSPLVGLACQDDASCSSRRQETHDTGIESIQPHKVMPTTPNHSPFLPLSFSDCPTICSTAGLCGKDQLNQPQRASLILRCIPDPLIL